MGRHFRQGAAAALAVIGQSGSRFTVTDAGADIWGAGEQHDAYGTAYLANSAVAGTSVTARVDNVDNTNAWDKAGLMLRDDIIGTGSSTGYLVLVATAGKGVTLSLNSHSDGYLDSNTTKTGSAAVAPVWLRLVRSGDSVTGSYFANGTTRTTVGTATLTGANSTEDAGMFFTAHGPRPTAQRPAPPTSASSPSADAGTKERRHPSWAAWEAGPGRLGRSARPMRRATAAMWWTSDSRALWESPSARARASALCSATSSVTWAGRVVEAALTRICWSHRAVPAPRSSLSTARARAGYRDALATMLSGPAPPMQRKSMCRAGQLVRQCRAVLGREADGPPRLTPAGSLAGQSSGGGGAAVRPPRARRRGRGRRRPS
ncbi:DUF1349 domain-containing protein [Streptomyces sp. NPDC002144]